MIDIEKLFDFNDEKDELSELTDLFENLLIDGPDSEQLYEMYGFFLKDIVKTPIIIKGTKLSYNRNKSNHPVCRGKMKGFEHIITRESKLKGNRVFDPERANKIHWIKPIIENVEDKRIKYFEKINNKGYNQQYYWYEDKGFMIIIKEINPEFMLITSFSVDNHEKLKFKTWYNEYKSSL